MVDPIQLTDAAKYYKAESQQASAFEWLQLQQTPEIMAEFAKQYRDKPTAPQFEGQVGYITPELMQGITGHPASSFDAAFCDDFNDMLESTGFDQHLDAMQMLMANRTLPIGCRPSWARCRLAWSRPARNSTCVHRVECL